MKRWKRPPTLVRRCSRHEARNTHKEMCAVVLLCHEFRLKIATRTFAKNCMRQVEQGSAAPDHISNAFLNSMSDGKHGRRIRRSIIMNTSNKESPPPKALGRSAEGNWMRYSSCALTSLLKASRGRVPVFLTYVPNTSAPFLSAPMR